tara:strand:+ start:483 stop:914 length:432 start_codon:yes stop_codon:yes gene_type:complete
MISPPPDDRAQMLLATGVVLMMSLLSMATYGVKMAGLNFHDDSTGDATISASSDVVDALPTICKERALIWYGEGVSEIESVRLAMDSLHDDVLHHGEIRGVELKLLNITVVDDNGTIFVSAQLGAADRSAMMSQLISFNIDLD